MQFKDRFALRQVGSCWIWTRAKRGFYGVLNIKGKNTSAHRYSYEIHKGPITPGMGVLHTCDKPLCVNPDHLYLGTQQTNMRDKVKKGRWKGNTKKRFCKRDHSLTDKTNIRTNKKGRRCKKCQYLYNKKYREKIKANGK